jgi:hypothetical protein
MRILTPIILAAATLLATAAARAQTYDPDYPVCLHVYGRLGYIDCSFTSLPQCNLSAAGRSAQCEINPFYANADVERPATRHHRRHHPAY